MSFLLPKMFETRMKELLKEEWQEFFDSYQNNKFQALRINALKYGVPWENMDEFRQEFHLYQNVPWADNAYYYDGEVRPGKHPYHEMGVYYIQEPSAMSAAKVLAPQPGMKVLDLCAAPGGKSTQLAAMLQGKGLLVANEINPQRCKILSQNMERMGVVNAIVTNEDSFRLAEHFGTFFHAILVDAPCSGEGMFRKNPEAMEEWSEENVQICADRQREILDNAAQMLLPGGRMVYSTCTFSPEENEQTIVEFLRTHSEFEVVEIQQEHFSDGRMEWAGVEDECIKRTKRLWPHKLQGEGHYVALLQKKGKLPELCSESMGTFDVIEKRPEESDRKKKKGKKNAKQDKLQDEMAIVDDFLTSCLQEETCEWVRSGTYEKFGEQLYRMPDCKVSLKGIRVLRAGLHIGEFKKNRFEPSHALALAISKQQVKNSVMLSMEDERVYAYFRGETFTIGEDEVESVDHSLKGWCLLVIDGMSAGWGKLAGGQFKNHYPKGLRRDLREKE